MSGSTHLRGIVIAGALAVVALVGGYFTLVMNQTASRAAVTTTILPLKDRHPASARTTTTTPAAAATTTTSTTAMTTTTTTTTAAKPVAKPKPKPKPKPVDPNYKAAIAAGLPKPIAQALAASPVAIVQLTTSEDTVAVQAAAEAQAGAEDGGAAYVPVDVDTDSTTLQALTRSLENVPDAPTTLIYTRPATLSQTFTGYVDEAVVAQAVVNAAPTLAAPVMEAQVPGSWASKANAVCAEANSRIAAIGIPIDPYEVTSVEAKQFLGVETGFLTSFNALTPPANDAAKVRQLSALLGATMKTNGDILTAAAKNDKAAVTAGQTRLLAEDVQVGQLTRELGAVACTSE